MAKAGRGEPSPGADVTGNEPGPGANMQGPPGRPEAAPPEVLRPSEVLRPKAAAPLRLGESRRAWLSTERQQTRMLRKVPAAPEAPARPQAASSAVPKAAEPLQESRRA